MRGRFITFEGSEGSGKSTQIALLANYLESIGIRIKLTREPGGTTIGDHIRKILLDPQNTKLDSTAELLLYAANRSQHVHEVILPLLTDGVTVLCDRFSDATLAYQGYGRGLDKKMIRTINCIAAMETSPDLTFLLDLDASAGIARAHGRNASRGLEAEARFENEKIAFHERVRQGYIELSQQEPERIRTVDASLTPEVVQAAIRAIIDDMLLQWK